METWLTLVKFLHILSVVFMAWPLYALITVNERGHLGAPLGSDADRYMENIIRGMSFRCYVFKLTALVTGLLLVALYDMGWSSLLTNGVLAAKLGLLLVLFALNSYIYFGVQPQIERLFARAETEAKNSLVPEEIASQIGPLRVRRKRLSGVCLVLVITIIMLGLQVFAPFNPILTGTLVVLAALFVWRAYASRVPLGWA